MTIDILGTGPSISLHDGDNVTIGVNDIFKIKPVDIVICLDRKNVFGSRLKTITDCRPKLFVTHLHEWSDHPGHKLIKLQQHYPGNIADIDSIEFPKSIFSPFVATAFGWKLFRPDVIRVFGCDMTNHKHLTKEKDRVIKHWSALKKAINSKGCEIIVYGEGVLMPVHE